MPTTDQTTSFAYTAVPQFTGPPAGPAPAPDPQPAGQTVAELASEYLESVKPKHRRWAERFLSAHVLPALGSRSLLDVTPLDCERLHRSIEAPASANHSLRILRAAFNRAERWGWVPRGSNPVRYLAEYENGEQPRTRILSPPERSRLWQELARLEASETPVRHGADWRLRSLAIQLLALTGLRSGEVIGLPWSGVDLDGDTPSVFVAESKTGAKRCYLAPEAVSVFERIDTPRDGLVFPWKSRKPVWTCWEHLRHECGFPDARIHDLRRTFWTVVGQGGVDLRDAAEASGHRNLSVHAAYYRHVGRERLAEIAGIGARAMRGG